MTNGLNVQVVVEPILTKNTEQNIVLCNFHIGYKILVVDLLNLKVMQNNLF